MAGVHAKARNRATRVYGAERVFERRLGSERLDGHVNAAPSALFDFSHDVLLFVVQDHVGPHAFRHLEARGHTVDTDDERGSFCACRRTQSDRTLREYGNGIAQPHTPPLTRRKTRRHDDRAQDHFLVQQGLRYFRKVVLCIRHQDVFGLTTVDGVSEAPSSECLEAIPGVTALSCGSRHMHARHWPHGVLAFQNVNVRATESGERHSKERLARMGWDGVPRGA